MKRPDFPIYDILTQNNLAMAYIEHLEEKDARNEELISELRNDIDECTELLSKLRDRNWRKNIRERFAIKRAEGYDRDILEFIQKELK